MFNNQDFSLEGAKKLDSKDTLASFRKKFHFPKDKNGNPVLYFCGNSLGLQPKSIRDAVDIELEDWEKLGVDGHFEGRNPWKKYHTLLTEPLARITGSKPIEVVAMNTLTNNLNSALISFYRPSGNRTKIMIEAKAFPSDIYSVKSHLRLNGIDTRDNLIMMEPRQGESILRTEDILDRIEQEGDKLATVLFGGVNYYTGEFFDIPKITQKAHEVGAIAGFDLAHTIGNVPLHLHDWEVDFAVWCSYKYLNAGPGATAGLFVHEKYAYDFDRPRLAGWWGHNAEKRFKMDDEFEPIPGAQGWQNSNPAILPLACLKASLEIFDEIGMEQLRNKSKQLTAYMESLLETLGNEKIEIITPSDPERRGAQLSIRVKYAEKDLYDRICARDIICDWREPDVIRAAPVPLYNSFEDIYLFYHNLREML